MDIHENDTESDDQTILKVDTIEDDPSYQRFYKSIEAKLANKLVETLSSISGTKSELWNFNMSVQTDKFLYILQKFEYLINEPYN